MSLLTLLRGITPAPPPSIDDDTLELLRLDLLAISNRVDTVLGYRSNLTDKQRKGIGDIQKRAQVALSRITELKEGT